jgi:hypothetical protein
MIAGRVTRVVNPKRNANSKKSRPRKKASARPNHRRRSAGNPAYLMTLGPMINPKRRSAVAKKKSKSKKSYAHRPNMSHAHRNSKNAKKRPGLSKTRVMAYAKSHGMKVVGRKGNHGRRNPMASSISLSRPSGIVQAGVGVLVGVAATKAVTAALPSEVTSSPLYSTLAAAAVAAAVWWVGSFINPEFGAAAGLGGIAEAGSIALNAFLPSVGSTLALSGLRRGTGDFVPGRYAVPQNPILDAATGLPKRQAMVVSAYPKAYGAA